MSLANFASLTPSQQEQVLDSPALQPPPGVQPNFYDPPNANHIVYPTIILALLLSSTFILLRIHGRWYCMKAVKIQDGIVAFLLFIAELAIYFEQIRQPNARGLFVHQWNIQIRNLRPFLLTAILTEWLQTFSPHGNRGAFYWACMLTMIVNALFWSIGIVIVNLTCVPHAAIYDKTIPGRCLYNQKIVDVFASTFNFTTDLIILVLPQGVIWKLRMSAMRRLGLSFVFAVGLLACISAGARLIFTISFLHSDDITYSYSAVALWTVAEVTCGFIVFSVTGLSKSFASFKHSKIIARLRLQCNSTTEAPRGRQAPPTQWKFIRPIGSKGDSYSEIEMQKFTPLEVSTFGRKVDISAASSPRT
ncbi:hypothetical protein F4859DRAFT_399875 [Xylaria cf. heliscus]|nr:hypothetical protein F4859DRAFT_399875 [Xylaria cf. heliscus]